MCLKYNAGYSGVEREEAEEIEDEEYVLVGWICMSTHACVVQFGIYFCLVMGRYIPSFGMEISRGWWDGWLLGIGAHRLGR